MNHSPEMRREMSSSLYPSERKPGALPPSGGCETPNDRGQIGKSTMLLGDGLSGASDDIGSMEEGLNALRTSLSHIELDIVSLSELDGRLRRDREEELCKAIQAPLFQRVIAILDRIEEEEPQIERIQSSYSGVADPTIRSAHKWVEDIRTEAKTDLRNLLTLSGVEWFRTRRGRRFDSTKHERVNRVETNMLNRHGRIARSRLYGYRRQSDGWVIQSERVDVYHVTLG